MGLVDRFFGGGKVGGDIAFYGLEDWWLAEFTDADRKRIQWRYQPMGSSENSLTEGQMMESSQSAVAFLGNLAGWFKGDEDRYLAKRIIRKAESLVITTTDIQDLHHLYQAKIEVFYRDRDEAGSLELAIEACHQQIDIATQAAIALKNELGGWLPEHNGFKQLAIILEKRKNYAEAIAVSRSALEQGWAGDWENRIDRCEHRAEGGV